MQRSAVETSSPSVYGRHSAVAARDDSACSAAVCRLAATRGALPTPRDSAASLHCVAPPVRLWTALAQVGPQCFATKHQRQGTAIFPRARGRAKHQYAVVFTRRDTAGALDLEPDTHRADLQRIRDGNEPFACLPSLPDLRPNPRAKSLSNRHAAPLSLGVAVTG